MFDKTAVWIKMLSTSLLALNMPELTRDYGSSSQFDIVSTTVKVTGKEEENES
jgi:hypothetical protein